MKKNTRQAPPSKKRSKENNKQNIIYGILQENDSQHHVLVGSKKYLVGEIKESLREIIKNNNKVKALLRPATKSQPETVKILRIVGPEPTINQRIANLFTSVHIASDFQKIVNSEANLFGDEVTALDKKNRSDLSSLAFCTIDGETAKDFDDAVFARKKNNNIEVMVAIADVSYYVKTGSALDEEAFDRGTSIYYPGHCIPMLPEQLSNGLCSLKPRVLRLAIVVSFELGPKGGIFRPTIKEAVIKSQARLTYNQVQDFFDKKTLKISKSLTTSLQLLRDAAHILRKARTRRGAIDFDLVESVVALDDQGEPIAIHPLLRLDSHKIIEDLMVATNEIIANYFVRKNIPTLYRIHEFPSEEKLENFFTSAKAFGALKNQTQKTILHVSEAKDLQRIMKLYQKSQYKETLNQLMLRAMMQARYSEKNLKHFGLASPAYLHFTSPIRRYADLIVHRQLRYVLFENKAHKKIPEAAMARIADSISQREMLATDLERKIDRIFSTSFMASRVGEIFSGVISACTEFGFFVRILPYHIEGLVHIANISRSHVVFMPEKMSLVVTGSNKRYMVGDEVKVKLINVNIDRGHIDFELVSNEKNSRTHSRRA